MAVGRQGWNFEMRALEARQLVVYALGLILLAIALYAVWRRTAALREGSEASSPVTHRFGRGTTNAALTVGVVLLWVFWVMHAMASFWLVLVVMTLPRAIRVTRRAVDNLLRPPGSPQAADGPPSVLAVCIERGIRAVLIISAVARAGLGLGHRPPSPPQPGDMDRPPRSNSPGPESWRARRPGSDRLASVGCGVSPPASIGPMFGPLNHTRPRTSVPYICRTRGLWTGPLSRNPLI
jgi:hypothetical protein